MSPKRNVEFGVVFTAEGDDVTRAVRALTGELRQMGVVSQRSGRRTSELGRSFRNIALRTVGIIATVRAFDALTEGIRGSVGAGFAFNEQMETAELAIASLLTAQARLIDANDRQLEGTEALEVATELAADQVRKLRVAGIQTAATTTDLVDAFQQAVGAGVQAGLTLDEIRTFTIRLSQAAGALGVPYRQLNEEIRSILSGTIDQNTRIAKAIGLTNQQLQQAREQGRLAEFLLERFEAFGVAGEQLTLTWAALKSNIQDAFSVFTGEATAPLFDQLKEEGQAALAEIFDLETAEIAPDFLPLVEQSQRLFAEVGDILAGAIQRGVDAAQELGQWLEANRETVDATVDEFGDVVVAVGHISREMGEILVTITRWNTQTGIASRGLQSVADIIEFIADHALLVGLALAGVGTALGAAFLAIAGVTAAKILVASTAVVALTAGIDWLITTEAEAEKEIRRTNARLVEGQAAAAAQASAVARLANEMEGLESVLADETTSADEASAARARMLEIEEELVRISPAYRDAIESARAAHESVATAVRDEVAAQRELLAVQVQQATRRAEELRARLREASAQDFQPGLVPGFEQEKGRTQPNRRQRQLIEELRVSVAAAEGDVEQLSAAYEELVDLLAGGTGTPGVVPLGGDDGDAAAKKALQVLRAQIQLAESELKRALQSQQTSLDEALRENRIAYEDYYDRLQAAQLASIDERIALQRRLLDATTEPEGRLQIEARILDLQTEREKTLADLLKARTEALDKYADAVEKIETRLLEAQGQTVEARRRTLEAEFRDLFQRMIAEGDTAGTRIILNLIDLELARARFKDLEDVIDQSQARLRSRIEEIELLEQTGALNARAARLRQAEAYQEVHDTIVATLPDLREMARLTGDPQALAQVQALEIELLRLSETIKDLTNEWRKFGRDVRDAVTDDIANALSRAGQEAMTFADFMRQMAADVVASIQRIIAEMVALRVAQAVTGLLSGGAGSLGAGSVTGSNTLGVSAATGGLIRGPGGPTDDRIPAWLSSGEYVIRAASVKKYGIDFFDELNRGARSLRARPIQAMIPRFAEGGLVDRPTGGGSKDVLRGEIGLDEGLIYRHLESPRGRRLMLDFVAKNRKAIASTLSS